MSADKKDLEIVYNLQWKRRINYGDDKANIIGMLDTPSTTLNWDVFKSYLLKNAGASGDINVSYIDSDDDEIPIDSQTEFQAALYSFRKRAHAGGIITLKLDPASPEVKPSDSSLFFLNENPTNFNKQQHDKKRHHHHRNPPENQLSYGFDVMTASDVDVPIWFQKYMSNFKSQLVDEITTSVIAQLKNNARKPKAEPPKIRLKKIVLHSGEPLKEQTKEYVKALKIERKLDNKLEKLEYKTKKIKEKKSQHARHLDCGAERPMRRPIGQPLTTNEILMDAAPLNGVNVGPPVHFVGGEIYAQKWSVVNNGQLPWTEETELRHAWGSQALSPVEKSVHCPPLQPGENGVVKVHLKIPTSPGNYECYWHFQHRNRRFGHWLGCQIIVDSPIKYVPLGECYPILPPPELHTSKHGSTSLLLQKNKMLKTETLELEIKPDEIKIEEVVATSSENYITNDGYIGNAVPDDEIKPQMAETRYESNNLDKAMNPNFSMLCIQDDSSMESSENSEYEVICIPKTYAENDKQPDVADDFVQVQVPNLLDVSSDQGSDDNNNNNFEPQAEVEPLNESSVVSEKLLNESYVSAAADDIPNVEESLKSGATVVLDGPTPQPPVGEAAVINSGEGSSGVESMCDSAFFDRLLQQSSGEADGIQSPKPPPALQHCQCIPASQKQQQHYWSPSDSNIQMSNNFNTYGHGKCHMYHVPPGYSCAAEDSSSKRLFVFPHKCPGYEVVWPKDCMNQSFNLDNSSDWNIHSGHVQQNFRDDPNERPTQFTQATMEQTFCRSPITESVSSVERPVTPVMPSVQLLPETFVTGAVNVASSAINTARSVLHMLRPRPDSREWYSAAWCPPAHVDPLVEENLHRLQEMGFWDRHLNITLLAKHKNNIERVIFELLY